MPELQEFQQGPRPGNQQGLHGGLHEARVAIRHQHSEAGRDRGGVRLLREEVKKFSGTDNISFILIANKIDLRNQEPGAITKRQGQAIARKMAKLTGTTKVPYVETSAKDNTNVPQAFLQLAEVILGSLGK